MGGAAQGNTVKVHYTGRLEDGTLFDTSEEREPMEVVIGNNEIIVGFEEALIGMEVGAEKTVTIPSDEAYGPHRPEMLQDIPREDLPDDVIPTLGQQVVMRAPDGTEVFAVICEVSAAKTVLDMNHPLAGKTLIFEIRMVEIT